MRLVLAGTPEVAVPSLRALLRSRHDVVGVVTRPDAPAGRGRRPRPSPVRVLAEEHGLPVLAPGSPKEQDFLEALAGLQPDCVPVVAYGALVPRAALDVPTHGWVNLHFSLLPAWRGAAPVQHALLAGDDVTGATVFRLDEGMDTGPVLATMTESVRPDDTAGALLERLAVAGADLLVAVMDGLDEGRLQAVPQPVDGVSRAPKLTVEDARLRWDVPAAAVDRRVRACTPAPGAWTTVAGRRLKVGPVRVVPAGAHHAGGGATVDDMGSAVGDVGTAGAQERSAAATPAPGEVVVVDGQVHVGTASGAVVLGDVQPEGKRAMPAADWWRGSRLPEGTRLGEETTHG